MFDIFRTKRAKAVTGGILGLGIVGGTAVAAILLTTNITGTATVTTTSTTANDLDVSVAAVSGPNIDCATGLAVSNDNRTLTFNPKLTIVAGGANSNAPAPGGDCTIKVTVKNDGDKAIHLDGTSGFDMPHGWEVTDFGGDALGTIGVGETKNATARVIAKNDAVTGPITGKLVYSD